MLAAVIAATAAPVDAGILGQWDFSQGWNPSTGIVTSGSVVPGLSLTYLPKTGLYQSSAAHGGASPPPNPPQLQFATTDSFGIANLGGTGETVVMRMPDMRGYGLVTGLMATFPYLVNGDGSPTKLNRYTVVMDVCIPGSTYAQLPPDAPAYLTLLQTRLTADGAWFADKRDGTTGVASSYGGALTPDAWHRLAIVMNLSDSGAVPQYRAYVDTSLAADIVPDHVPQTSQRNVELVTRDLYTDKAFSLAQLNDSYPGLGTDSAFFLFNADRNDALDGPTRGELGTLFIANLQFRDDPLTSQEVAALGGPAPGYIPVPEPATWIMGLAAMAYVGRLVGRRRTR